MDTYEDYGRNRTVTLTVRRYVGLFGPLTVNWETTSIGTISFDFYPSLGLVHFDDGQETAEITVYIVDDELAEEMEVSAVV